MKYQTLILLIALIFSCNKEETQIIDENLPENRSFRMGFTAFPYDFTAEAINETYENVGRDGDVYLNHLDHGVPWEEAFRDLPFPDEVQQTLQQAIDAKGSHQKLFLTATPTNQDRSGLANYWNGEGTHQELPEYWKTKKFDDPEVIDAYIKYCKRIIDFSQPDFFAYGIEINASFKKNTKALDQFMILADRVYQTLKEDYPQLPIMLTFQDQSFNKSRSQLIEVSELLAVYSDFIAISTYPFWQYDFPKRDANPALFTNDWLEDFRNIDPTKPFVVSETGYIAQDLVLESFGVNIKGTEEWQKDYVQKLCNQANELNAEFICWFVYRDYDPLYNNFQDDILKIWRDNGLLDENGIKRPAYMLWVDWLALPLN